jgi:hypothetical protein
MANVSPGVVLAGPMKASPWSATSVIGVSIQPGTMVLTRIWCRAHDGRKARRRDGAIRFADEWDGSLPLRTPATAGREPSAAPGRRSSTAGAQARPWSDGTTHLLFEPVEFLEKLAAVTPRPEINLVLYHGVLAPHARWRAEVVAYRRADIGSAQDSRATIAEAGRGRLGSPRYWMWAALMRRAFDLAVLRCPRCAGRMQLIATIEDPAIIQRILAHLGLPGTREGPQPPCSQIEPGAEQLAFPGLTD